MSLNAYKIRKYDNVMALSQHAETDPNLEHQAEPEISLQLRNGKEVVFPNRIDGAVPSMPFVKVKSDAPSSFEYSLDGVWQIRPLKDSVMSCSESASQNSQNYKYISHNLTCEIRKPEKKRY